VRAGSACRVHGVQGQVHRRGSAVHSKAPQSALRRTHRHPTRRCPTGCRRASAWRPGTPRGAAGMLVGLW